MNTDSFHLDYNLGIRSIASLQRIVAMPRQATRSAANRGPLDKLRGPVRKMAEEVFSVDTDRSVLKDEPLMNGLSELQTKQVSLLCLVPIADGPKSLAFAWWCQCRPGCAL